MITRRAVLYGAAALLQRPPNLYDVAAAHVTAAETHRPGPLWGRIGGSAAEHASARLLQGQLRPYFKDVALEEFTFDAWRPLEWQVAGLASAMPAPFEARFPHGVTRAPLTVVEADADWSTRRRRWLFLRAERGKTQMALNVREKLLYQKAVAAGAAGFIFSTPTPRDATWRSIVPVDKAYALRDERYPDGRRPIPCFSVDARDGDRVATMKELAAEIRYDSKRRQRAFNVVAVLPGSKRSRAIGVMTHLDAFFSGACDNATGIATLVGLAWRLSSIPASKRHADFHFLGLAAHHDSASGLRAFVERSPARFGTLKELIALEHTDAVGYNDGRVAYLGNGGWPEVRSALPRLVRESGVMTRDPEMRDACISDLLVTCSQARSFTLLNSPPFYHTDHDKLDKITGPGIERAVDFHVRLFAAIGALSM